MIKFFRNIRQTLINEGKTSRYFKYAIGEIVLVVIGILIALQINNWNEANKENNLEVKLMLSLHEDLQADTTNLNDLIKKYDQQDKQLDTVLKYFHTLTKGYKHILWRNLYSTINYSQFIYTDRTIKQLKSTGDLKLIHDRSLTNKIIEYDSYVYKLLTSYYTDLEFYYQLNNQSYFELIDYESFENDANGKTIEAMENEGKNYLLLDDRASLGKFNNSIRHFKYDLELIKNYEIEIKNHALELMKKIEDSYNLGQ